MLASRLVRQKVAYLVCVTSLGFAYLTWYFASQGEPVPFFLLFTVLCLLALIDILNRTAGVKDALLLALVSACGALFHQQIVLVLPFAVAVLWMRGEQRLRVLVTYLVVFVTIVGLPYVLVGRYMAGKTTIRDLFGWATGYLDLFEGTQYGTIANFSPARIARGLGGAFVGGMNLKPYLLWGKPKDGVFYLSLAPFGVLALYIGLGLLGVVARIRVDGRWKPELKLLAAFALVFGVTGTWWGAHNRTFWTPVVVSILVLVGMGYATLLGSIRRRRLGFVVGSAFVIVLIVSNLFQGILARHSIHDDEANLLTQLTRRATSQDVVIIHDSRMYRLLDYYASGLRIYPVVRGSRGEREPFRSMNRDEDVAVREAIENGHRVFVSSDAIGHLDPHEALGLPPEMTLTEEPGFTYDDPFTGLPYTMRIFRGRS